MSKLDDAKAILNNKVKTAKQESKNPGFGWEIAAYVIRTVGVGTPAIVIMCLEDSWVKTGIGLLATLLIIAMLIIFKEPIKTATAYAPGVLPFAIFVVLALFFQTSANALLTIGISGLASCGIAIPFHAKYLSQQDTKKTPELEALEAIAKSLEK